MLQFWAAGWKNSDLMQCIGSKDRSFDSSIKKSGIERYLNTSVKRVASKNTGSVPRCIICAQACEGQAFHLVCALDFEDHLSKA